MADTRAASRYVKSLLGLAVEKNVLDQVHNDMLLFSKVVESNREFRLMIQSPVIKHDMKRSVLEKVFKGKVHALTMSIFDIITKKNREPLLPAIASGFHEAYNAHKGITKAIVTTAVPMDAQLRAQIEGLAKKFTDKQKIELVERINPDMIGGFVLSVGDKQIDASIQNNLKKLKVEFSQNPYIKEF